MFSYRGYNNSQNNGEGGPAISAVPFRAPSNGRVVPLLSERERGLLAGIAAVVRFGRDATIYREGDRADFIYNIAQGVVKTLHSLSNEKRYITTFLFADDLFGLAKEGIYVNEAQAVTAYRIPIDAFDNLTRHEPMLDYSVLLKLIHELREDQRHGLILARHDALGKIALFVRMLERLQNQRGGDAGEIYLPMRRSDIADYVGISLPAVSRAFHALTGRNVVRFSDRRHMQIVDRTRFDMLVSDETRATDDQPQ